jgi:hypothetical protein
MFERWLLRNQPECPQKCCFCPETNHIFCDPDECGILNELNKKYQEIYESDTMKIKKYQEDKNAVYGE